MDQSQQNVHEFMTAFGQACPTTPSIPDYETRKLRVKLLLEEVLEFAAASGLEIFAGGVSLHGAFEDKLVDYVEDGEPDLVGVADGLADIQYVNDGAANAFGIDLAPVKDEVHGSNMTKLWTMFDINANLKVVDNEPQYNGVVVSLHWVHTGLYVVKDPTGKVIKSPSYTPADIASIIDAQLHR